MQCQKISCLQTLSKVLLWAMIKQFPVLNPSKEPANLQSPPQTCIAIGHQPTAPWETVLGLPLQYQDVL